MSRVAILLSVVFTAALAQDRSFYEQKFFSWLQTHMIKPSSGEVFVHYLENFIENDKFIEMHNSAGNSTFIVGHNQFSHMNSQEWKDYVQKGLVKPQVPVSTEIHTAPSDVSGLPASVDWTTKVMFRKSLLYFFITYVLFCQFLLGRCNPCERPRSVRLVLVVLHDWFSGGRVFSEVWQAHLALRAELCRL